VPQISQQTLPPGDIMIVDDNPANLKLLEGMLEQQGHEVRSFPLGRLALASARSHAPDLILLDINMPEMNGYEVCERLKADEELSHIPVIFLSALNEIQDKVRAFRCGAVDYIAKPFHFEEVQARVETHLKLHLLQRELQLQNERLEQTVAARTRELAESNARLSILDRSKSEFLTLISHEFRTPLIGLLGVGDLILEDLPSSAENNELREMFDQSRRRILSILDDALLLTQFDVGGQQFGSAPVLLHTVVHRALGNAAEFAGSRGVALTPPPGNREVVLGNEELLVRALQALVETAVKFSSKGGAVDLSLAHGRDSLSLVIESRGRTIPSFALPKLFDIFAISDPITPGGDLGLGPPLAYRILSLFSASVDVVNLDPEGIRMTIRFPLAIKNEGPPINAD
jgi:two-component system sensor histidine kinase/response regulator